MKELTSSISKSNPRYDSFNYLWPNSKANRKSRYLEAVEKSTIEQNEFSYGPTINKNPKQTIADEKSKESFWRDKILDRDEARYDLVEEALATYIGKSIYIDKDIISKLHWWKFLDLIKNELSSYHNKSDNRLIDHIEYPCGPTTLSLRMYDGLVVTRDDWMAKVKPSVEAYLLERMHWCLEDEIWIDNGEFWNIWDPVNEIDGVVIYANAAKYWGSKEMGWKHGVGCLQLDNGDTYEGNFVKGKWEGYGKMS